MNVITVVIKDDLVKHAARGLSALIVVDLLCSPLFQSQRVGNWFTKEVITSRLHLRNYSNHL